MRISGILTKHTEKGKTYFLAEIAELMVVTDGETREEAVTMAQDAVGLLLEDHTDERISAKDVSVYLEGNCFDISCKDTKALISLLIKQIRGKSEMTLKNVTEKMGQTYVNSVKQYETGNVEASFSKFQDLIFAMGYDLKISLVKIV
jgi:predicted RNase H-like HicB family nuclease